MTITKQEFFACYQQAVDKANDYGFNPPSLYEWTSDLFLEWSQPSDGDSDEYLSHCEALYEYYENNLQSG